MPALRRVRSKFSSPLVNTAAAPRARRLAYLWEKGLADFEHPELLATALHEPEWKRLGEIFADKRLTGIASGGNAWEAKALRERLAGRLSQARPGERP